MCTRKHSDLNIVMSRFQLIVFVGEHVEAGNILMRQRTIRFHPGANVGIGIDRTIYALSPGTVKFTREPRQSYTDYLDRLKKSRGTQIPGAVNLTAKKEDTHVSQRRKEKRYINVLADPKQVRFVRVESE